MSVASTTRYSLMPTVLPTSRAAATEWVCGCHVLQTSRPLPNLNTQPGMLSCACTGSCSHAPRPTVDNALHGPQAIHAGPLCAQTHVRPRHCAATEPSQPSSSSTPSTTSHTHVFGPATVQQRSRLSPPLLPPPLRQPQPPPSSSSSTTTTTSQLDNSQCTQPIGAPGGGATHRAGTPCGQQAR